MPPSTIAVGVSVAAISSVFPDGVSAGAVSDHSAPSGVTVGAELSGVIIVSVSFFDPIFGIEHALKKRTQRAETRSVFFIGELL